MGRLSRRSAPEEKGSAALVVIGCCPRAALWRPGARLLVDRVLREIAYSCLPGPWPRWLTPSTLQSSAHDVPVDLEAQTVTCGPPASFQFSIAGSGRDQLLNGWDEIDPPGRSSMKSRPPGRRGASLTHGFFTARPEALVDRSMRFAESMLTKATAKTEVALPYAGLDEADRRAVVGIQHQKVRSRSTTYPLIA